MDIATDRYQFAVEVVSLSGRLDALEAGPLRELLDGYHAEGKVNLAIDLTNVEFVDSAGLAALVKGMKDARREGGDVRLVRPASADAMRVFELTRFDKVFEMSDDVDTLLNAW